MSDIDKLKNNFQTFNLILFVRDKFKHLLILTAIGAIVAIIVSLVIKEKYKSTVILFPTPSTSVSKALLSDNVSAKGVATFGEEEEAEQLLQVLNSDQIRNKVIEKFNLLEHYDIKPDTKFKLTVLRKKYESNVTSERTEFNSIEINVLDEDPQIAADMANYIACLIDTVMNSMMKQRSMMALQVVEAEYLDLKNQIETLEDSLVTLRGFGIYDYESQAEVISDAYAQAIAKGMTNNIKKLEEQLGVLAKYGGAYVAIRDFLEFEKKQLSDVKSKYAQAKVDAYQNLPHKYIVDNAYKAEKKSFPIRWLIVVMSTIGTFMFALLLLILMDFFKQMKLS